MIVFSLVWGISAGTGIGQVMVKVLPPSRLGKIVLDGVINPVEYFDHTPYYTRCTYHFDHPSP
jgi:hypothetical protein